MTTPAFPSVLLPVDRVALASSQPPSSACSSPRPAHPTESNTSIKHEWPPVYAHQGTIENPLIPKRRRRTTPEELKILETEFLANNLPSQEQRLALSLRLGMTGRALQVWFQNRRQKEKKDASSYNGGSGASSTGSTTDPDRDAADMEGLSFSMSSSPLPSPLHEPAAFLNAKALESLPSSEQIYRRGDANKENQAIGSVSPRLDSNGNSAPLPSTAMTNAAVNNPGASFHRWHISAAQAVPIHHTFKIPSTNTATISPPLPIYANSDRAISPFQHRPSNASGIAAKKFVHRRPLGSHAPTARKPSLPHAFNFPSSPDAASDKSLKPPALRRTASNASINSNASESFSLQTNESGRARAVWLESQAAASQSPATMEDAKPASTPATIRGFKTRDEVWQSMHSDAPSSPGQSPAPLTRKMMLAHAQAQASTTSATLTAMANKPNRHVMLSSEDAPSSDVEASHDEDAVATASSITVVRANRRPNLSRSLSLGGNSTVPATEGSRAGGQEACAISALERKRQRVLETAYDNATAAAASKSARRSSSSSASGGGRSANGRPSGSRRPSGTSAPRRSSSSDKSISRKVAKVETNATSASIAASVSPSDKPASPIGSFEEDGDSSMGELSFSSTSTTSTASSIGTPTIEAGSFFPTSLKAPTVVAKRAIDVDEERECAELLLGLGGFCA